MSPSTLSRNDDGVSTDTRTSPGASSNPTASTPSSNAPLSSAFTYSAPPTVSVTSGSQTAPSAPIFSAQEQDISTTPAVDVDDSATRGPLTPPTTPANDASFLFGSQTNTTTSAPSAHADEAPFNFGTPAAAPAQADGNPFNSNDIPATAPRKETPPVVSGLRTERNMQKPPSFRSGCRKFQFAPPDPRPFVFGARTKRESAPNAYFTDGNIFCSGFLNISQTGERPATEARKPARCYDREGVVSDLHAQTEPALTEEVTPQIALPLDQELAPRPSISLDEELALEQALSAAIELYDELEPAPQVAPPPVLSAVGQESTDQGTARPFTFGTQTGSASSPQTRMSTPSTTSTTSPTLGLRGGYESLPSTSPHDRPVTPFTDQRGNATADHDRRHTDEYGNQLTDEEYWDSIAASVPDRPAPPLTDERGNPMAAEDYYDWLSYGTAMREAREAQTASAANESTTAEAPYAEAPYAEAPYADAPAIETATQAPHSAEYPEMWMSPPGPSLSLSLPTEDESMAPMTSTPASATGVRSACDEAKEWMEAYRERRIQAAHDHLSGKTQN